MWALPRSLIVTPSFGGTQAATLEETIAALVASGEPVARQVREEVVSYLSAGIAGTW